jgi:hypothetical protein
LEQKVKEERREGAYTLIIPVVVNVSFVNCGTLFEVVETRLREGASRIVDPDKVVPVIEVIDRCGEGGGDGGALAVTQGPGRPSAVAGERLETDMMV